MEKTILTIGHSIRSIEEFIELLILNKIKILADVRSYPGSRRFPHFNRENLISALKHNGIEYLHIKELGGRREIPNLPGTASVKGFQGFAAHMKTEEFKKGIDILTSAAVSETTSYMCSEADWRKCHRSLISDYLKSNGWNVIHIIQKNKTEEHVYTKYGVFQEPGLFVNNHQ